jgi:hypothetical protein
MTIQDLLKMGVDEATKWLIDNQYDFELSTKARAGKSMKECRHCIGGGCCMCNDTGYEV